MNDWPQADVTLDARGLECPLPILRTRAKVADMQPGQRLLVLCTDPHAELDFEAFSARFGHPLEHMDETDGEWHFLLKVGSNPAY